MKRMVCMTISILLIFSFAGCASMEPVGSDSNPPRSSVISASDEEQPSTATLLTNAESAAPEEKHYISLSIDSEALSNNLIDMSPKKTLYIYLPPSYYSGEKDYPVVYYLHGFGEPAGRYLSVSTRDLDEAFESGAKEFIMVEIQGDNYYYVNSPVTGNWEDYVMDEVIPLIDESFNTIPDVASRGICGFSMGGFGTVNLALRHPDVFCAFYAMSPGLMVDDGFANAMDTWSSDKVFLRSYSRAFAPDTDSDTLGHIPSLNGSDEDNAIVEKWKTGFGNLDEKLDAYLALGIPLKGMGFSYGTEDYYNWIPAGTQYFSDLLTEQGIENTLFVYKGGHTQPPESIKAHIVPFFNEFLTF